MKPTLNGDNGGRDERGRFTAGNRGGTGNPLSKRVNRLRSALLNAVSEADMQSVIAALVEKAKKGDVAACRVLFERVLGPPIAADIIERIEILEAKHES